MSRLPTIEISLFNKPNDYNKNYSSAIEQFKNDVSKLYAYGLTYSEALNYEPAKNACLYLIEKFKKASPSKKFPYYIKFVNYVYTRDEVRNPFGNWFEFDFWDPLLIMQFAEELIAKRKAIRIQKLELSSLIFIVFQYRNYTSGYDILQRRRELHPVETGYRLSENQRRQRHNLSTSSGLTNNKAVLFIKPQYLYDLVGLDSRTFKKYLELLGLEIDYEKRSNNVGFSSKFWIYNIQKLYNEYQRFATTKKDTLNIQVAEENYSGVLLSPQTSENINAMYENSLIRDKNIKILSYMKDNPLIRIQADGDNIQCSIQSDFYDFRFLLASLYVKASPKRNSLKTPINDIVSPEVRKIILSSVRSNNLEKILELIKSKISNNLKPISTPKDLADNRHFEQINKSRKLIAQIQSNGLLIDTIAANQLLEELIDEKTLRNVEEDDEDTYKDEYDEDYSIPESEQIKNLNSRINELENILAINQFREEPIGGKKRIYGIITPHGASTHRMTARNINIQGINKATRKKILCAPEGYTLISPDVSGQDIIIAASLANKLYSNPDLFPEKYHEELALLAPQITGTIDRLVNQDSPINFIVSTIFERQDPVLTSLSNDEVRNIVKQAVYSFFYGGGKVRFVVSKREADYINFLLGKLKESCKELEKSLITEYPILIKRTKRLYPSIKGEGLELAGSISTFIKNFSNRYLEIETLPGAYIIFLEEELNDLQNNIEEVTTFLCQNERRAKIFDLMKEIVEVEYPGILESFNYYKIYYELNQLTYPTLLGFQTPVILEYNPSKIVTRSKSYPVQASGAEFIRQWLIEFDELVPKNLKSKKIFKIINAIHDQLLLEVKIHNRREILEHVVQAARLAGNKLGIKSETINITDK